MPSFLVVCFFLSSKCFTLALYLFYNFSQDKVTKTSLYSPFSVTFNHWIFPFIFAALLLASLIYLTLLFQVLLIYQYSSELQITSAPDRYLCFGWRPFLFQSLDSIKECKYILLFYKLRADCYTH